MQTPGLASWLTEYIVPVNSALEDLAPQLASTPLERAVHDAVMAGGKRVRAVLALLWCEVFSGDYRPAIPLAVAYELAHASALIQDDIIDGSEMRRGESSIGVKYGSTTALLASDLLLFNVPKMIAKYENLESHRLARALDLLGDACRATTWGEFIDMEMAYDEEGTEERYEEMIRLKTSSLLSAPCASGALVGGASDDEAVVAGKYGEEAGLAYQIQDDTLDIMGEASELGKPIFTDLRGGKKSLVLMHCVSRCSAEERKFVVGLTNRRGAYTQDEVQRLRGLMLEKGSLDYIRKKVWLHTDKARAVLASVPTGPATARLDSLTEYLAARYY